MTFLCILFVSPLYFLSRKKWGGFVINSVFYGLAVVCIVSIVGIMFAPVFWLIGLCHAIFYYRKEQMVHHAEMLATKMAEKMQPKG